MGRGGKGGESGFWRRMEEEEEGQEGGGGRVNPQQIFSNLIVSKKVLFIKCFCSIAPLKI